MKQERPIRTKSLIRSCEAARILGVSREYVRQLVVAKALSPKYLFNASAWRKIYIFEKQAVLEYKDRAKRKTLKWKAPVRSEWMTAIEAAKVLKCKPEWIYHATKRGLLQPRLIVESSMQKFRLYDKDDILAAIEKSKELRVERGGHTPKTMQLMETIRRLHTEGLNDSEIASETKSTQPFISKLRTEMGLISNAKLLKRRRPRRPNRKRRVSKKAD